jgi:hypothetical protein
MGNFASSCTTAEATAVSGAKVVLPDGRMRNVDLPATCAELMLEAPGHFVADGRALRPGRRTEVVGADEELQCGALYAALPMKRLGAPAAPADLARLSAAVVAAGGEKPRRKRSMLMRSASSPAATAKVAAVFTPHDVLEPSLDDATNKPRALKLDEMTVDDAAAAAEIEELRQRLSGGRRCRRPTLETIPEECYALPARR